MTKVIVFSDLHCHNHRFGAEVNSVTNRHSRLQDCLDVLEATHKAAEEHKAVARIFCGDMFHVRGRLTPSVFNPVAEHYKKNTFGMLYADELIVGNHDQEYRVEGEHAVKSLGGNGVTVRESYGTALVEWPNTPGKVLLGWVSYTPDVKELKKQVAQIAAQARLATGAWRKICLIHHGVDGAMPMIPDMGFGILDLPRDDFDFIFCGDYHMHKELIPGKAWMIGAPLQHTFGDVGQKRGYMVVDLETGVWEHVENTTAPKFITWDYGSDFNAVVAATPDVLKGNFVRIRADEEQKLDLAVEAAEKAGAKAVQRELVRNWEIIRRADMALSMTLEQMFVSWLKTQDTGFIDHDFLIEMNVEILKEAGV